MFCFTLVIGEAPKRGISITMEERSDVPALALGGTNGMVIPVDGNWFKTMADLDRQLLQLPEFRGKRIGLPLLLNTDIQGDGENAVLVSRPGFERDKRALVRLVSPPGEKVTYTGSYRIEKMDERERVVTRYPSMEDVVGIEVLATYEEESLVILHPGSAFRAIRPGMAHVYRLLPRPHLIEVKPAEGKSRGGRRHSDPPEHTQQDHV